MAKQIMQVIAWTQAEGFLDAYRNASPNARGVFHTAAIKLAARADQLSAVETSDNRSRSREILPAIEGGFEWDLAEAVSCSRTVRGNRTISGRPRKALRG